MKQYDPRAFLRLGRREQDEAACRLWWSGSGIRMQAACGCMEIEAEFFAADHAPGWGCWRTARPLPASR